MQLFVCLVVFLCMYTLVCMCVCVYVRERERVCVLSMCVLVCK